MYMFKISAWLEDGMWVMQALLDLPANPLKHKSRLILVILEAFTEVRKDRFDCQIFMCQTVTKYNAKCT